MPPINIEGMPRAHKPRLRRFDLPAIELFMKRIDASIEAATERDSRLRCAHDMSRDENRAMTLWGIDAADIFIYQHACQTARIFIRLARAGHTLMLAMPMDIAADSMGMTLMKRRANATRVYALLPAAILIISCFCC